MPIDYAKLKSLAFADIEFRYTGHDTIFHALGVGCRHHPADAADRRPLCEEAAKALPALAMVLNDLRFRHSCPDTGADWSSAAPVEQGLVLHRPLPAAGTVIARTGVTEILDEGPGKNALLHAERVIFDGTDGTRLCTVSSTTVLRGQGGFGGPADGPPPPHAIPARAPDRAIDLPALYRPTYRPSHGCVPPPAGPATAPGSLPPLVLHELAGYTLAGRAVLQACCDGEPTRLESLHARFAAPVFPGETIRTEIWRDGPRISFRCRVTDRDSVVLDNGLAIVVA